MTTKLVTYFGPREFLLLQPTTISGSYDPEQVKTVSLVAEGKYPLGVTHNPQRGLWHVILNGGFNTAGNSRWFLLSATDAKGRILEREIINFQVSTAAGTTQPSLILTALADTLFQEKAIAPDNLTAEEKVLVPKGKIYRVNNYAIIDDFIQVELGDVIAPIGKYGYFHSQQVQLTKGAKILYFNSADLPPTPPGTQLLWVKEKTNITLQPQDNLLQRPDEQAELGAGETYQIRGYASISDRSRVSLSEPILGFGDSGYVPSAQVEIVDRGQMVKFNLPTTALRILNNTVLKKMPIDEAFLKPEEKVILPTSKIYGVSSYAYEDRHLKVTLTENLPSFGNRGYMYPDFVQLLANSQSLTTVSELIYEGPEEILVRQPVVLRGRFNPASGSNVTLIAEDKYPLVLEVERAAGTWEANLTNGFYLTGPRWLRLKVTDSKGNTVESKVININVTTDDLMPGEDLTLKVLKETLFKVSPADSRTLNEQQKFMVAAGTTVKTRKYGLVGAHLKVLLDEAIAPFGNFGYFYEPHVEISKGSKPLIFDFAEVPDTNISAKMLVVQKTFIKARPDDSSTLSDNEKVELLLGENYNITGYACTRGHFRVTLAESIPGLGNVGYVYWLHVKIKKFDKEILYNPNAITATIRESTFLKKEPVNDWELSDSQKVRLPLGRVYGVTSYAIEGSHVKVSMSEEFPGFGNTGYLRAADVLFQRGGQVFDPIPDVVELSVPYFSQLDNPRFYWSTCNVTSIAMIMYYYGERSRWGGQLEDELLEWCFRNYGQGSQTDHSVLSALIRAYGYETSFSTTRRWSEVDAELVNRRPVVLAGDMTASGHIVTVIGYTPTGYLVHDPWGDALTGYADTNGRNLFYPFSYLNRVSGPDGNVWAHFIRR
jgi:hypothetical protein